MKVCLSSDTFSLRPATDGSCRDLHARFLSRSTIETPEATDWQLKCMGRLRAASSITSHITLIACSDYLDLCFLHISIT